MEITWDDCIKLADEAILELRGLMCTDPAHGVLYQQEMAIMMYRRMQAVYMKAETDQSANTLVSSSS